MILIVVRLETHVYGPLCIKKEHEHSSNEQQNTPI